jgi:hypothetical protein
MSSAQSRWLDDSTDNDDPTIINTTTIINNSTGGGISAAVLAAAIAAADRIRGLRTHPPLSLTGPSTLNEYGLFALAASSQEGGNRVVEKAFDRQADDAGGAWASLSMYNLTSGLYEGTARLHPSIPLGEFVTIEQPYRTALHSFSLTPTSSNQSLSQMPANFRVYGTNDDSVSWTLLSQHVDVVFVDAYVSPDDASVLTFDATEGVIDAFSKFAVVIEAIPASDFGAALIGQFQLYQHIAAEKVHRLGDGDGGGGGGVVVDDPGDDTSARIESIESDVDAIQAGLLDKAATVDVYTRDVLYTRAEVDTRTSGLDDQITTLADDVSTTQADLLTKADIVDVYDKTQVYTKGESDALTYQPDDGTLQDQITALDTSVSQKANAVDVYNKTQVYTKAESDALVYDDGTFQTQIDDVVADITGIDTTLQSKADTFNTYDKTEVYTKSQSDALFNLPVWGRLLVGYMKVRYNNSTGNFINVEPPFNLSATYISSQAIQYDFGTWHPDNDAYIVNYSSDNQNLNHSSGSGSWYHTFFKSESNFRMNVFGSTYSHGHVYTVSVYHDNMVL